MPLSVFPEFRMSFKFDFIGSDNALIKWPTVVNEYVAYLRQLS